MDMYHKFKKDDVDQFMDNDIYMPTRTIWMGSVSYVDDEESGVDYAMAERAIKALHILDSQASSGDKPITVIMNNIGGDVFHGMAIYDAIRSCKNHVTIKTLGHAMSMGAIILQAADVRSMSKNSRIMIHYGNNYNSGHAKTTYKWNDEIKKIDEIMENIFLEKIGDRKITLKKYLTLIGKSKEIPSGPAQLKKVSIKRKELQEMLNFDTFFDAKTALELGFIDEIID